MANVNKGIILKAEGLKEGEAVYNPFPVQMDKRGRVILAARVESESSDWQNKINQTGGIYDPRIQFFCEEDETLYLLKDAPLLEGLEDPFCTWIIVNGEKKLLFGGVRVHFEEIGGPKILTEIYLADSLYDLTKDKLIVTLPGKDNRFCQSELSSDLVMLNRPTTGEAFPGKITYSRVTLDELKNPKILGEKIAESKILKFSFLNVKYGGNALYNRIIEENEKKKEVFHLICHIALADRYTTEEGIVVEYDFNFSKIHYKAYEGIIDPENLDEVIGLKQIAEARDFPENPNLFKNERYEDVVFPGGIMNGYLYMGVGDGSVGKIPISQK